MTGPPPRGWLIAVEGIDGAGKSTFIQGLRRAWRRQGKRVALWREPVDPALGRQAQAAGARDPWTGALWFTVDRARAAPRLELALRGADVVLSDRSFYSTLAYQASALPARSAAILTRLQPRVARRPDRVIWLRLHPELALARIAARQRPRSPLERRRTLERVHRAYSHLARSGRWLVLDARADPDALVAEATRRLGRTVARRPRP